MANGARHVDSRTARSPRPAAGFARRTIMAAATLAIAVPALAADAEAEREEGFGVRVAQSFRWDDNVFRLPDGRRPRDGSRSDRISRTAVGLTFDHTYSLQRFVAALDVARRSYDEYDQLDTTTQSGSLRWDWAAGKQWSGTASLLQREAPRSFDDTDQRVRDINTLQRARFDAGYWIHPDWSIVAGIDHTRSRFSERRSEASEYDETGVEAGVGYRPKSGNSLALVVRRADGEYPNRGLTAARDPEYEQRDLRLRGVWTLSGISRLSGYVGYTDREYSTVRSLDFSGPTGRLTFDWTPTGKLSLRAIARREIGSEYEVIDNYVVTRGFGIEADWAATGKITVRARAERLRRDNRNTPFATLRDDRRRTYGVGVEYQALRTLTITASAQRTRRLADDSAFDYDVDIYAVDVKLLF